MAFVYMFLNLNNEVIYVGHTKDIVSRMQSHFSANGHIDKQCYKETAEVRYSELNSLNEARVYEIYYISKLKPKYNQIFSEGGGTSFTLPEITFETYQTKKMLEEKESEVLFKAKKMLLETIDADLKEIELRLNCIKNHSVVGLDDLNKYNSKTLKPRLEKANRVLEENTNYTLNKIKEIYAKLQS